MVNKNNDTNHKYDTRSKKMEGKKRKCKQNESSDDDDSDEEIFDMREYNKLLAKLFPSKYMDKKINEKSSKKNKDQADLDALELAKEYYKKNGDKQRMKECSWAIKEIKNNQTKKKNESEVESEEEESEIESEEEESEIESDSDSDSEDLMKGAKFNIIFTMGEGEDYDSEDYSSSDESYNPDSDDTDSESEKEPVYSKKRKKDIETDSGDEADDESDQSNEDNISMSDSEIVAKFKEMALGLKKQQNNEVFKKINNEILIQEKDIKTRQHKKERKQRNKNVNRFKTLLKNKHSVPGRNDFNFFKDKLSLKEQEKLIEQTKAVNEVSLVEKPYRIKILESDMPNKYKAIAMKKINALRYMEPGSGEYHKMKTWLDMYMSIPHGVYKKLPVDINDGLEATHKFLENAEKTLNECVYGLDDAKLQIMQLVGQWITNPSATGTAIGIWGPPGTGKTSLVKNGISKILGRDFAFIALGGTSDASSIEGHSYTYEGSQPGRLVTCLTQNKSMNLVFYFDELDKVSDTDRGREIIGTLTHITDNTQNDKFHDKYFGEVDFDISRCLFIFSYNDESKINPILKDRMYSIKTRGYTAKEKVVIATDYLTPKIRDEVKFNDGDIVIPEDTLKYIIENFTEKEQGVRNLKRCLEIIHTKINLYRLVKPGTTLFKEDISLEIQFPMTVTPEIVDKLIKKKENNGTLYAMYM